MFVLLSGACAEGSAFSEVPEAGVGGYSFDEDPVSADAGSDGEPSSDEDDGSGSDANGGGATDDGDGSDAFPDAGLEPPESDAGAPDGEGDAGSAQQDAGSGEVDAGGHEGPIGCAAGLTECPSGCVQLASAESDCGACGNVCADGESCRAGRCEVPAGCTAETFGEHAYLFCSSGASWGKARNNCLSWGMDLAILESQAEHDFVQAHGLAWIGLNDLDTEGSFTWVPAGNASSTKGQAPGFTAWVSGEPNNAETCVIPVILCSGVREHCVELRPEDSWNDEDCSDVQPYVCESY